MVANLVASLVSFSQIEKIIVTLNIPEDTSIPTDEKVLILRNSKPKGYGENNNNAFKLNLSKLFCILNPDIVFEDNPFPSLIENMHHQNADLIAPKIINHNHKEEDSMRFFPSPSMHLKKFLGISDGRYISKDDIVFPDWITGLFMLFNSDSFKKIDGFDTKYFLYYEDVDICMRLALSKMKIVGLQKVHVIHNAQRMSRRNLRYTSWHMQSIIRYYFKYSFKVPSKRIFKDT